MSLSVGKEGTFACMLHLTRVPSLNKVHLISNQPPSSNHSLFGPSSNRTVLLDTFSTNISPRVPRSPLSDIVVVPPVGGHY